MRLLIVNLHFDIGGVETLLARIIPLLSKAGVDITLLLLQKKTNPELITAIAPYCKVIFLKDAFPYSTKKIRKFLGAEFDVAFYTISRALLVGSWLLTRAGYKKTKASLGAYQTEIFCPDSSILSVHHRVLKSIIKKSVPASSIIFGNTAGRDFHAKKLDLDLSASHVIRIFVDTEKYTFVDRSKLNRNKIVSIGRITSFKTYNFTFLRVIKDFLHQGKKLEWHIHGDGEQMKELASAIEINNLSEHVFLHGAMPYSDFEDALDGAFLFLGSGTSLIEAAACGAPSLTTIEYADEPITYGFISEIQSDNLIEPEEFRPTYRISEKLSELMSLSAEDYKKLQIRCEQKAQTYSGKSIIEEYKSFFEHASQEGRHIEISTALLLTCTFGFFATKAFEKKSKTNQ